MTFFQMVQSINNCKNLSVVLFLLSYSAMQFKVKSLEDAPFHLPLFKGLWEMEVEHLSGALRLQTINGGNDPESSQHL